MAGNEQGFDLDPRATEDDAQGHGVTWQADRPNVETGDADDVTGHVGEVTADIYGDDSRTP